jgi:sec-independent protein translocase protein TatA
MTGFLSPSHVVLLLIVVLLVFGAGRLPELGRALGHGMREFKDSISGASPAELPEPAAHPASPPSSDDQL